MDGEADGCTVGAADGPAERWLHAPAWASNKPSSSEVVEVKPVRQLLVSVSQPHDNCNADSDEPTMITPTQSCEHSCTKQGSMVGEDVGAGVGSALGAMVGARVGLELGAAVGAAVGTADGFAVGPAVGVAVGIALVGAPVGIIEGDAEGEKVWWSHAPGEVSSSPVISAAVEVNPVRQRPVSLSQPQAKVSDAATTTPSQSLEHSCARQGSVVGVDVGDIDGELVGDRDGAAVGERDGDALGESDGERVGNSVGAAVGDDVGATDGETVGDSVGERVGDAVGDPVWWLHAPGKLSIRASISAVDVWKPVRQRLTSVFHPHAKATPLATTSPVQSLEQPIVRQGS